MRRNDECEAKRGGMTNETNANNVRDEERRRKRNRTQKDSELTDVINICIKNQFSNNKDIILIINEYFFR